MKIYLLFRSACVSTLNVLTYRNDFIKNYKYLRSKMIIEKYYSRKPKVFFDANVFDFKKNGYYRKSKLKNIRSEEDFQLSSLIFVCYYYFISY